MLPDRLIKPGAKSWAALRNGFAWPDLDRFNIAEVACERWALRDPDRIALTYLRPDGEIRSYTYLQLSRASSRLANAFEARGIRRGDRVAVLLPQTPETVLTHLAAYKLGAVVVPLFTLFGEDGLKFRLENSGARAVVTDGANLEKVFNIRDDLTALDLIYSIDSQAKGTFGFWQDLGKAADDHSVARTGPDDPAFISYTSGTTGPPKGALHGHRVLLGHLPGVELHHNSLPQPGDCLWTPADWAWMGGLTNVMLPALTYGVPLVAHRMAKFDPEHAYWLMAELGVRNTFLPPTALKLMRQVPPRTPPDLRSVASGGEALGAEMLEWARGTFGQTVNEFFGQTECNLVLSNSYQVMDQVPGSMGKPVPGHEVAVIDSAGKVLGAGETGEIAVHRPDPAMFLEYWKAPDRTRDKFIGDWMRTGDEGYVDEKGYFHFSARTDDVITSSGYRIGPTEIEDCLTGHEAVAMAAVVGVPDPVRTEAVKAFVVLRQRLGTDNLKKELIDRVRSRISPHVAPREVTFVDSLPMTATGKIMRRELKQAEAKD